MILLTIDPGVRELGWCLMSDVDGLLAAGLSRAPAGLPDEELMRLHRQQVRMTVPEVPGPTHVRVERMRHYANPRRRDTPAAQMAKAEALLRLTLIGSEVARAFPRAELELVRASEWKGQMPHPVLERRVLKNLRPYELERLPVKRGWRVDPNRWETYAARPSKESGAVNHNVIDAGGVALHRMGRLK